MDFGKWLIVVYISVAYLFVAKHCDGRIQFGDVVFGLLWPTYVVAYIRGWTKGFIDGVKDRFKKAMEKQEEEP